MAEDFDDPDQPQRHLSPVGLYSHAVDVAQKFPQMKGTPRGLRYGEGWRTVIQANI